MRYEVTEDSLIVRGNFFALSSGVGGGWGRVDGVFNHTVCDDFEKWDPKEYVEIVASRFSLSRYFGLLTSVPMSKLAVSRKDDVTVFATAGVRNPNPSFSKAGTVNIIVVVEGEMSDGAMVNAVITATEAKSFTLIEEGCGFTGTNTDAVVIAKESNPGCDYYEYSGPASELGAKIWGAVIDAVRRSLRAWKL